MNATSIAYLYVVCILGALASFALGWWARGGVAIEEEKDGDPSAQLEKDR